MKPDLHFLISPVKSTDKYKQTYHLLQKSVILNLTVLCIYFFRKILV